MITVDALRAFGANTEEGLGRCLNNETFYLRLVGMALDDANFAKLEDVLGNLGLTPLFEPDSELTELLRSGADADYPALVADLLARLKTLTALREG